MLFFNPGIPTAHLNRAIHVQTLKCPISLWFCKYAIGCWENLRGMYTFAHKLRKDNFIEA